MCVYFKTIHYIKTYTSFDIVSFVFMSLPRLNRWLDIGIGLIHFWDVLPKCKVSFVPHGSVTIFSDSFWADRLRVTSLLDYYISIWIFETDLRWVFWYLIWFALSRSLSTIELFYLFPAMSIKIYCWIEK